VRLLGWGPEIAALELVFSYEDPLFVFPCAACFRSAFAGSGTEGKDPNLPRLAAA